MTQSSYAPETMPQRLALIRGAAQDVRLNLLDQWDEPEDLSGASAPQVDISEAPGETPIVTKTSGDITIEPGGDKGVLAFTLTTTDTALLTEPGGVYLMQAQVTIGGNVYLTQRAEVDVAGSVT